MTQDGLSDTCCWMAHGGREFFTEKVSPLEVCPKCALPSNAVYDRRWVRLKDDPLRGGEPFSG
jgi:hypothetical protein